MAERDAQAKTNASEGKAFLAANAGKEGVTTTECGVQFPVLVEGKAPKPTAEDTVKAAYKGELLDGNSLARSTAPADPSVIDLHPVAPRRAECTPPGPSGDQ